MPQTKLVPGCQMALPMPVEPDQVRAQALRLYRRSPLLQRRYATFEAALQSPVTGRALELAARQILRNRALADNRRPVARDGRRAR